MRRGKFELFRDVAGQWRWRLFASNGRVMATSGESFGDRTEARKAARRVARVAAFATLVEVER